ncbi:hypothetical protein FA95DRAFT_209824 [Auriscalpium vulgare]|uniref:Uncharacterized protein n=1 Tax=Auriscalpium vulgare TaxID=40419 RepID=A0ACB8RKV7_9AGAM|nr:hypothetical protein FA95DRAFT_209824 [Auriscalpium vulgare]
MKGAKRMSYRADASYYVEQLTNIRDLDSEWEDDEVEEVMIISPKTRASTLPRTSSVLSSAMTAAASTPTLATQIPLPPSPHQGAYTVLRTLGRTPTSTLALAVTSQSTAQHSLVVVRACRRPLARRDRTERACLELLSSARAGNVYVQKMLRTWEDGPALYMVFEYCDGGDLLSYLQRKRIEPAIAASWARGIVRTSRLPVLITAVC